MYRPPSSFPNAPAIFEYAVAKWLCQKSVIFSWSGRREWTIRNSQRCRESVMLVAGANAPRAGAAGRPGVPPLAGARPAAPQEVLDGVLAAARRLAIRWGSRTLHGVPPVLKHAY